jgi:hypothetical protein
MELLAARQQNPVAPPYIFFGKVVRPNVQLDPEGDDSERLQVAPALTQGLLVGA